MTPRRREHHGAEKAGASLARWVGSETLHLRWHADCRMIETGGLENTRSAAFLIRTTLRGCESLCEEIGS
jgi:hypothetical protein